MQHLDKDTIKLEKIIHDKRYKDLDHVFEPSMKVLLRITKIMLEAGSIGRTSLSEKANLHYYRLGNHLGWLEKKHLVESILEDNKTKLRLTEKGMQFVALLYSLDVKI